MGLTNESTWIGAMHNAFEVEADEGDIVIALAGNPNTGKSTVFNSLTGMKQHTGNWPGKTVTNAQGKFKYKDNNFVLVDLPGTYSLMANSVEEEVARDFICFGRPHAVVIVVDSTCIERNLNLVLQTLELTDRVVMCLNLTDEAERKGIIIDHKGLSKTLGIPVVKTNARDGVGLDELKEQMIEVIKRKPNNKLDIKYNDKVEENVLEIKNYLDSNYGDCGLDTRWLAVRLLDKDEVLLESIDKFIGVNLKDDIKLKHILRTAFESLSDSQIDSNKLRDEIVTSIVSNSEVIYDKNVTHVKETYNRRDRQIDSIVTSKVWGIPIMIALLGIVFWLTIQGANYPSQVLANGFNWLEGKLLVMLSSINSPQWLKEIIVLGVYRTLGWVISVMLPPMAIFFPLFTLLEDFGYLPRVAFNLDNFFKKACAHGKQALTMCMGFGCNAAGVISTRIINSPRERLIAILTNNFVPCNGRFPTLIALATIFIAGGVAFSSVLASLTVVGVVILGIMLTLLISKLLSKTILKGMPSSFTLELPPYRRPQIGRVIVRSIFDRTLFVLLRAIVVAAPAGIIIWLMANLNVDGASILVHCAQFLDPFARLLGMDGFILMAFILGFPANEIVVPIIIMSYMATGSMLELDSLTALKQLLVDNGWTWLTAVCVMLFSLNHFPCGTTILTIAKETQSKKWPFLAFIIPTIVGIVVCFIVAQGVRLFGLV